MYSEMRKTRSIKKRPLTLGEKVRLNAINDDRERFTADLAEAFFNNAQGRLQEHLADCSDGPSWARVQHLVENEYDHAQTTLNAAIRSLRRRGWRKRPKAFARRAAEVRQWLDLPEPARQWPYKWITSDPKIRANLDRKRLWYVLDVLDELFLAAKTKAASASLAKRNKLYVRVEGEKRIPVFSAIEGWVPSAVNLSDQQVWAALRASAKADIIRDTGMKDGGHHGPKLWMIGYWTTYVTERRQPFPKPVLFIRNNESYRRALATMSRG